MVNNHPESAADARLGQALDALERVFKKTPRPKNSMMSKYSGPRWTISYDDGVLALNAKHQEERLDEILQMFEHFCKGCGFEFGGFAIVDEDGIPVSGLNPLAKLEVRIDEDPSR